MRKIVLAGITGILSLALSAQGYQFTEEINLDATPVISQGRTGTCWSFSTTSFLESEILRISGKEIDISEMYNVRYTYPVKAENYLMRQGKAQFSEGGLAHDVINSIAKNGMVPQEAYTGLDAGVNTHNHAEMVAVLSSLLETYIDKPTKQLSDKWHESVDAILDVYLGSTPEEFKYEGKNYTPQSFLDMTGIVPEDYVTVTSFTQAPFYTNFILNIPDNFSNGSMYNVPLDEMMSVIDEALKNGYTIELDCDVSEPTFSAREGIAVIPLDETKNKEALQSPVEEKEINQAYRQQLFENQQTTDDHLMHITGSLLDQNGTKYYKVKNSWGSSLANGGHIYMSESYMRLKTISVMIHKDALPKSTRKKLEI